MKARAAPEQVAARRAAVCRLTQEGHGTHAIARRLGIRVEMVRDDRKWLRERDHLPPAKMRRTPRASHGWPRPDFDALPCHVRAVVEQENKRMRQRCFA